MDFLFKSWEYVTGRMSGLGDELWWAKQKKRSLSDSSNAGQPNGMDYNFFRIESMPSLLDTLSINL